MMKIGGFSVFVSGTAMRVEEMKTFSWGWQTATSYEHCESQVVIEAGAPGAVQITIHGDHLFLDDLFSETPMLLFGLVAQADDDGDGDGEITQAELKAVDIRPLANWDADVDAAHAGFEAVDAVAGDGAVGGEDRRGVAVGVLVQSSRRRNG